MLTVLMECRDQEPELAQSLAVLVAGAVEGLVSDVVVLDHGSKDGSERVADAAGCRFHSDWNLGDVLGTVRGEWLLLMEAGARPQFGWVDELSEYVTLNRDPARFSPSRTYRRPLLKRLMQPSPPLETGIVLSRSQALSVARADMKLCELARGLKSRRLSSEMIPAWAARSPR
ncbi:glycosyl transferase [Rhizobiaceae bacterium BDR2-2]|uniref:Glycosyl transferase n=1 Tax=Ectorhizobium quercum TaxID=2965071 RepID=A0AAE3SUW7_9HYPH|nr:glycosyl transferase [Ectorhizobium quercum]MCX8996324.1 glycosyl transferase [Ectorhizobium quercum]MCX8998637.1 glycosyl transferase [Ectorhizobium quercum]